MSKGGEKWVHVQTAHIVNVLAFVQYNIVYVQYNILVLYEQYDMVNVEKTQITL